ncbi:MAG TPA: transcriptional regulator, partial [Anaeromyxobacter sp.]|nr:transcriptional regulator [Anaeromyxobacter sp.]
MVQESARFTFGPFELDVLERGVRRAGAPLRLTPKTVDVLIALVERRGAIVEKEWLLERVWHGICVEECNLAQHVATLRRVFGDNPREPAYIETIPRRGYRFVAPVARSTGVPDVSPHPL